MLLSLHNKLEIFCSNGGVNVVANEISLELEYVQRDGNGKLEYEGISFVEDKFPAFLKQTISPIYKDEDYNAQDRKSTRLNSSHSRASRMPSSA